MKLQSVRIKNFRTISAEQQLDLHNGLTIVGPNSSGKTNILKAIEMLFTGSSNKYNYSIKNDLTLFSENAQTGIIGTFDENPNGEDQEFYEVYKDLLGMLEIPKEFKTEFNLYLYFTKTGTPVYRFFSNETTKSTLKAQFSRKQLQAISLLLDKFVCHYVPSSKSIADLYASLLLPFVRRAIGRILEDKMIQIESELRDIAGNLDEQLTLSGLGKIKSSFVIPNGSLEDLLSTFEFRLSDPNSTSIERKGMGIQAAAILSSFLWITREEKKIKKSTIWLVEEPESYLHPELAESCNQMLQQLQSESLLVATTHSLGFVNQDPNTVAGTNLDGGHTKISIFKTYIDATNSLRKALGIRFSDYYNLGKLNCFVEGKSDREVFKWALQNIRPTETGLHEWKYARSCEFLDLSGISGLEGFLKATYAFIHKERPAIVVIDGDSAGNKTRINLQQYFGQHQIPFNSNSEFISLPSGFSLEGLFPHDWIVDVHAEHEKWFSEYSIDVEGKLQPFNINSEQNKAQLRNILQERASIQKDLEWATRFIGVFDVLDQALSKKVKYFEKNL